MAKVLPDGCDDVSVPPAQLSLIVGAVQFATAWQDALALIVTFAGQFEITGATTSRTVTLKEHAVVFPAASLAVYVTTVVPFGNVVPGA